MERDARLSVCNGARGVNGRSSFGVSPQVLLFLAVGLEVRSLEGLMKAAPPTRLAAAGWVLGMGLGVGLGERGSGYGAVGDETKDSRLQPPEVEI
jgi:hypothetical protein